MRNFIKATRVYGLSCVVFTGFLCGCEPADSPDVLPPVATATEQPGLEDSTNQGDSKPATTGDPVDMSAAVSSEAPHSAGDGISSAPDTDSTQVSREGNLVVNGYFDSGLPDELPGWGWWKDHGISRDTDEQFPTSLRVYCRAGQDLAFVQPLHEILEADRVYELSGFAKTADATGTVSCQIVLENGHVLVSTEPMTSTDWTKMSKRFAAFGDMSGWKLALRYQPDPDADEAPCTVWFANIEIREAD